MPHFIHKLPIFNLNTEVVIMLQASMLTDILHDCTCEECGKHIASEKVILEYATNHVDEVAKTTQEREYLIFMLGLLFEDRRFWNNLFKDYKQVERTDTLIEIIKVSRAEYGVQTNTQTSN